MTPIKGRGFINHGSGLGAPIGQQGPSGGSLEKVAPFNQARAVMRGLRSRVLFGVLPSVRV